MSIEYKAVIEDEYGSHITTISNFTDPTDGGGAGLDYILNVSSASSCLLTIPSDYDLSKFHVDGRVVPMRSIHGRSFYNDNQACYMIRKYTITDSWYRISSEHATGLADRRSVAYASGSTFANKSAAAAGNQIKAYLRENLGASVSSANRDGDDTATDLVTPGYLSIEADKGDGASVSKTTDRGSLLGVIQDIASDSITSGTYIGFGINYQPNKQFAFVTKASQWGIDRRNIGPDYLLLSPERGNMGDWKLEIDYKDEVTVAYAGGRGQNDERIIATAIDTQRMNISPFNRRERYYDATSADTVAAVQAVANARLREGGPKITLTFDLVETPKCTRGLHFDLGDIVPARVTVKGRPFQFDYRIDTIYVSIRNGRQDTRVILTSPI